MSRPHEDGPVISLAGISLGGGPNLGVVASPQSPGGHDHGVNHSTTRLLIMGKMALLSMLVTREAVGTGRQTEPPLVGGRGMYEPRSVGDREGASSSGGPGGPCRDLASFPVASDDIDAALVNQRAPYEPPDLRHSHASDFKVPMGHLKDMPPQHAQLGDDSAGREFYGSLDVLMILVNDRLKVYYCTVQYIGWRYILFGTDNVQWEEFRCAEGVRSWCLVLDA